VIYRLIWLYLFSSSKIFSSTLIFLSIQ
jgi:hypothetical protein